MMTEQKEGDPVHKGKSELVSFLFCMFTSLGLWCSFPYLLGWLITLSSEFPMLPFLVFGALQMAGAFAYWLWRHPGKYFVGMVHGFLSVVGGLVLFSGFLAAMYSKLSDSF